jgi:outer membrane protein OmpA-like peptidoglycan-associated protein
MLKNLLLCLCFLFTQNLFAQNLVPNYSFEETIAEPCKPKFGDDTFYAKYWTYCNYYKPNYFHENCIMPQNRKGLPKAKTGSAFVALETYKTPQYLTVELKKALKPKTKYYFEFWICRSYDEMARNDNHLSLIEMALSDTLVYHKNANFLKMTPIFAEKFYNDLKKANVWQKMRATFVAPQSAKFLIMGHFNESKAINERSCLFRAAYFIDDIQLYEVENENKYVVFDETIAAANFSTGETLIKAEVVKQLENFVKKALEIKKENCTIFVEGHTDNIGNEKANLLLSQKRADVVKNKLMDLGLSAYQIQTFGLGSKLSFEDNNTELGREKNRRVTIKVIRTIEN